MFKKAQVKKIIYITIGFGSMVATNNVFAAGYQIAVTSAKNVGDAYSLEMAGDNPMAVHRNPSIMMLLDGTQMSNSFTGIYLDYEFEVKETPYDNLDSVLGILPIDGGYETQLSRSSGQSGTKIVVPSFAYTKNQGNWAYGVSAGSHFAYELDPKKYNSINDTFGDFYIKTAHITGNLAFQVNDQFNVGVGVSVVPGFFKAERQFGEVSNLINTLNEQNVAFGLEDFVIGSEGLLGPLTNSRADLASFSGDGIGFNWSVGLTYQPNENNRFGFAYHHKTKMKFKGDYVSDLPALDNPLTGEPLLAPATGGEKVEAETILNMPEWATFDGWHRIAEDWELGYSLRWTGWKSNFQSVDFEATDNSGAGASIDVKSNDTLRYSIGLAHTLNDKWKIRGGIALDEGFVNDKTRIHNTPDSDRWWFSAGFTYTSSPNTSWDVGFSYITFDGDEINEPSTLLLQLDDVLGNEDFKPSQLLGFDNINVRSDYDINLTMFGVQYNKKF